MRLATTSHASRHPMTNEPPIEKHANANCNNNVVALDAIMLFHRFGCTFLLATASAKDGLMTELAKHKHLQRIQQMKRCQIQISTCARHMPDMCSMCSMWASEDIACPKDLIATLQPQNQSTPSTPWLAKCISIRRPKSINEIKKKLAKCLHTSMMHRLGGGQTLSANREETSDCPKIADHCNIPSPAVLPMC